MRTPRWLVVCAVILALLLASAAVVQAQTGGGYDLSWNTIDGGGGTVLSGGSYTLQGTIGQPDAGVHFGGPYVLGGGFWMGSGLRSIYLPVVLRQ
jgi:hypothetical protein